MNQEEIMMLASDSSEFGEDSQARVAELTKALLAPGSVNDLYATPGGSLTMQSLEAVFSPEAWEVLRDPALDLADNPHTPDEVRQKEETWSQLTIKMNISGFR